MKRSLTTAGLSGGPTFEVAMVAPLLGKEKQGTS
jgi:hypothetical protein